MIARTWHGWTKRADAKAYEEMLRNEIFPGIAAHRIDGYRAAELFNREDDDEIEFLTALSNCDLRPAPTLVVVRVG
jgi:hypothetical protein